MKGTTVLVQGLNENKMIMGVYKIKWKKKSVYIYYREQNDNTPMYIVVLLEGIRKLVIVTEEQ